MSDPIPRPGIAQGSYPERRERERSGLEQSLRPLTRILPSGRLRDEDLRRFSAAVEAERAALRDERDVEIEQRIESLRQRLFKDGPDGDLAVPSFALISEQARRVLGMEPYPVQLMAGYAMLRGMLAEMQTGEGKTLTAVLPTCCAALAGIPVHVVTVNDYLVERDAELMRPLYESLGLTLGIVLDADTDLDARRAAYAADITYVTNKQVAFDYLRDRMARQGDRSQFADDWLARGGEENPLVMRGLCFAIIDEADSVLIDEAGTPLILSQTVEGGDLERISQEALQISETLVEPEHYRFDRAARRIELTDAGRATIDLATRDHQGIWQAKRRREELIGQALQARFLYVRDEHYLVRDGQVMIIDRNTGRVMPDRSWEMGLHQMVESKEGLELSGQRKTLARISYQKFYGRYLRLCGMTGTAEEVRGELRDFYDLDSITIPTRRPVQRRCTARRVFATRAEKLAAITRRVRAMQKRGRPTLIGVNTVAESLEVSQHLEKNGIAHEVLNASNDHLEAQIIEKAGLARRVTVATSMAGRGTDIKLGPGVEAAGGLHVISTVRAEAGRIDRQLFGRCGRQGDLGSYACFDSLEDPLLEDALPAALRRLLARGLSALPNPTQRLAQVFITRVQRRLERRAEAQRRAMLAQEAALERTLAFTGQLE